MSKISIEGKPIYALTGSPGVAVAGHLYLVYTNDNGEEFVLRGGPSNTEPPWGAVFVAPVTSIELSPDSRIDNGFAVTPADRGNITLPLGNRSAEDIWNLLLQYGDHINNQQIPYDATGPNSNTVIANLLYLIGIDVNEFLPDQLVQFAGLDLAYIGAGLEFSFNYTVDGTNHDDYIRGNGGNQTFNGGEGNDTLIGGSGSDTLFGGIGNNILVGGADDDTYIVNNTNDVIIEQANGGLDQVISRVTYTLSDNIENLTSPEQTRSMASATHWTTLSPVTVKRTY